jgi:hypothetical protein
LEFLGQKKERLKPGAKIDLSLMAFVLRLDMNLGKDRAKAKGEAIHGQILLRLPSRNEL